MDISAIQALLASLDAEQRAFLGHICLNVNSKAYNAAEADVGGVPTRWDGWVFKKYIQNVPQSNLERFRELASNSGVYETFKRMNNQGARKETSEKVFCLSAMAQHQTLAEHLAGFILYCQELDYVPKGFSGYEHVIDRLLKNDRQASDAGEDASLSMHDNVLIGNEIDAIRKDMGFYPYGITSLEEVNRSKAEAAFRTIEKVIGICGQTIELAEIKVSLLCILKKFDEALEISQEMYQSEPDKLEAVLSYGMALTFSGGNDEAVEVYKKAESAFPNDVRLFFNIARNLDVLERYDEAEKSYLRVISIEKRHLKSYINLARLYRGADKHRAAEFILRRALTISPNNKLITKELFLSAAFQKKYWLSARLFFHIEKYMSRRIFDAFLLPVRIVLSVSPSRVNKLIEHEINDIESNPLTSNTEKHFRYSGLVDTLYQILNFHHGIRKSKVISYIRQCRSKMRFLSGRDEDQRTYFEVCSEYELKVWEARNEGDTEQFMGRILDLAGFYRSEYEEHNQLYLLREAVVWFKEATKIRSDERYVSAWFELGLVFYEIGFREKSPKLIKKSIAAYEKFDKCADLTAFKRGLADSKFNNANNVQSLAMFKKSKRLYLKSVKCFDDAHKMFGELDDKIWQSYCLRNKGVSYLKLFFLRERKDGSYIDTAIKCFQESIRAGNINDDPFHIANTHVNLGDALYQQAILKDDVDIVRSSISSYQETIDVFTQNDALERCHEVEEKCGNVKAELERCLAD